jgi:hypothetical protein
MKSQSTHPAEDRSISDAAQRCERLLVPTNFYPHDPCSARMSGR